MNNYRVIVYIQYGGEELEVEVDVFECNEQEARLSACAKIRDNLMVYTGYTERIDDNN